MQLKEHLKSPYLSFKSMAYFKFSYFSAILLLWSCTLGVYFSKEGLKACSMCMVLQCLAMAFFKMNEGLVVVPLLLFTQLCYGSTLGVKDSKSNAMLYVFYGSSLCSIGIFLAEMWSENRFFQGRICWSFHFSWIVFLLWCLFVFVLARKADPMPVVVLLYAGASLIAYLKLYPLLGCSEASIVGSLIGYYVSDVFVNPPIYLLLNANNYNQMSSEAFESFFSRDILLFSFIFVQTMDWVSRMCESSFSRKRKNGEPLTSLQKTKIYAVSLIVCGIGFCSVYKYCLGICAFTTIVSLVMTNTTRFFAVLGWAIVVPLGIFCIHVGTRGLKKTIRRKLFHLLAFSIFTVPAVLIPTFLSFCISSSAALFILLEVGRYRNVGGFSPISFFFRSHIDSRESVSGVVRSHIYLLYGFSMSMFFSYRFVLASSNSLFSLSANVLPGIVGLGLVDTGAALGGRLYGKERKLSRYFANSCFPPYLNSSLSHKTWPGLLCGAFLGITMWTIILSVAVSFPIPLVDYLKTYLVILTTSVLESFTDGIDNLQLPILTLSALYTVLCIS